MNVKQLFESAVVRSDPEWFAKFSELGIPDPQGEEWDEVEAFLGRECMTAFLAGLMAGIVVQEQS